MFVSCIENLRVRLVTSDEDNASIMRLINAPWIDLLSDEFDRESLVDFLKHFNDSDKVLNRFCDLLKKTCSSISSNKVNTIQ